MEITFLSNHIFNIGINFLFYNSLIKISIIY